MVVSVQFIGNQRALTKTRDMRIPLMGEGRVRDIFRYLLKCYPNFPLREAEALVMVNDNAASMKQRLNPDDDIVFLPHVGGG